MHGMIPSADHSQSMSDKNMNDHHRDTSPQLPVVSLTHNGSIKDNYENQKLIFVHNISRFIGFANFVIEPCSYVRRIIGTSASRRKPNTP